MNKEFMLKLAWVALLALVVGMVINPIGIGIIRLGIVLGIIAVWVGGLIVFWKSSLALRFIFFAIAVIAGLVIFIPGSDGNSEVLRNTYVNSLTSYDGVRYIWGGENKIGIDCSALVREGYVDANFKVGLKTLNPKLLRKAFSVWWYDCSADALGNEYKGMTKLVLRAESMEKLDYSNVKPGDIIVAEEGFHTFAYLGNNTWIEANPEKGKVLKVSSEEKAKSWSGIPIKIVRWTGL